MTQVWIWMCACVYASRYRRYTDVYYVYAVFLCVCYMEGTCVHMFALCYVCICLYGMQYVGICVWKLCACVYCGQYVLYNIHMIVCWYACTCEYSCLAFVYMCVEGYIHIYIYMYTILQVRTVVKASILDENSVSNLMHKRHQALSSWGMKMT